jgi:hypothetical protein
MSFWLAGCGFPFYECGRKEWRQKAGSHSLGLGQKQLNRLTLDIHTNTIPRDFRQKIRNFGGKNWKN